MDSGHEKAPRGAGLWEAFLMWGPMLRIGRWASALYRAQNAIMWDRIDAECAKNTAITDAAAARSTPEADDCPRADDAPATASAERIVGKQGPEISPFRAGVGALRS